MKSKSRNNSVLYATSHDVPFIIFLCILTVKELLFIYLTYDEKITFNAFILAFCPTFGITLFLVSISLFIKNQNGKLLYLFSINTIFSLLYLSQALYFRYFNDFGSLYNVHQISLLGSILPIIVKMIDKEIFLIADLLLVPFIFPWLKKQTSANISINWARGFSLFLLVGLLFNIFPLYIFNLLNYPYFKSVFERKILVFTVGIVNYQIYDIYNYVQAQIQKNLVTEQEINSVRDWFKRHHSESMQDHVALNVQKWNVIVIQVESLQNFIIGIKWDGNEVTPNLDRLVKNGLYFNQIYDQTWAGNTSDATFLANCSLYPSRRGAASFLYAQNDYYCLPHILKDHGYTIATMHAFRGSYWNRLKFEKALGFEKQFYEDAYVKEDELGWGISDKRFFAQSIEKIINLQEPFYVLLTTLTTHVPFEDVTADIDDLPLGELEGTRIGNYLRSMHYVDSAIGDFLQDLAAHGLIPNTMIIIYGDHRARFQENDLKTIGIIDMDELIKIPVIIKLPNKNLGQRVDTIGGLIDLAPTISNILGIDISSAYFLGKNLLNEQNSFVIFRDGSFLGNNKHTDQDFLQRQLAISDLILEKDLMKKNDAEFRK